MQCSDSFLPSPAIHKFDLLHESEVTKLPTSPTNALRSGDGDFGEGQFVEQGDQIV